MSHFLLFYPHNIPKNQNFEKWKKPLEISSFYICVPKNYDQIIYRSWETVHDRCNCYCSFWAICCPFSPLTAQKIKIFKKWKKHLEISSFYISVPKIMIRWCTVPEIWCATDEQTVGWMGEQTEKVKYRGGCPPKKRFNFSLDLIFLKERDYIIFS